MFILLEFLYSCLQRIKQHYIWMHRFVMKIIMKHNFEGMAFELDLWKLLLPVEKSGNQRNCEWMGLSVVP